MNNLYNSHSNMRSKVKENVKTFQRRTTKNLCLNLYSLIAGSLLISIELNTTSTQDILLQNKCLHLGKKKKRGCCEKWGRLFFIRPMMRYMGDFRLGDLRSDLQKCTVGKSQTNYEIYAPLPRMRTLPSERTICPELDLF